MISMELQREVPQYMAIPWLMTWVMARTVSAGGKGRAAAGVRGGRAGRRGLLSSPAPGWEVERGCVWRMLSEEQDRDRSSRSERAGDRSPPDMLPVTPGLSSHGCSPRLPAPAPYPAGYQRRHRCRGGDLKHCPCAETQAREEAPDPVGGVLGSRGELALSHASRGQAKALLQPQAGRGESKGDGAALARGDPAVVPRGKGLGSFFAFLPWICRKVWRAGGVFVVLPLPPHLVAGLVRVQRTGMEIARSGTSAPGSATGTRAGAACGQGVPSTMKVLDLEELNRSPGDKREI